MCSPGCPGEPTGSSPSAVPSASAPSQEGPMHSASPDTHDPDRCHHQSRPRPKPHGSGRCGPGKRPCVTPARFTVPPHVDDGPHGPVTIARARTGEGPHGPPPVASVMRPEASSASRPSADGVATITIPRSAARRPEPRAHLSLLQAAGRCASVAPSGADLLRHRTPQRSAVRRQRHAPDPPSKRAEGRTDPASPPPAAKRMDARPNRARPVPHTGSHRRLRIRGLATIGVTADRGRPWHARQTARQTLLRSLPPHAGTVRLRALRRLVVGHAVIPLARQGVHHVATVRALAACAGSRAAPRVGPAETPAKASLERPLQAGTSRTA